LPVAAGLGGGSSDAAAALRLLAQINNLAPDDRNLMEAAKATGADVPVCLDPRSRVMCGVGDILSSPVEMPPLPALLVNPGVMVSTARVFSTLRAPAYAAGPASCLRRGVEVPRDRLMLVAALAADPNDLEEPAMVLAPEIAAVLAYLRKLATCRLARMSGSGATCFGLFNSSTAAAAAVRGLRADHPAWWVRATVLAG
jgi:4-diphosphocytidyl-2-C-methyl-D-erythritol kinase